MNILEGVFSYVYTVFVRRYPMNFRLEFEDEMCDVFDRAISEAKIFGLRRMVWVFLREIKDFPSLILFEHWHSIQQTSWDPIIGSFSSRQPSEFLRQYRSSLMSEFGDNEPLDFVSKRGRVLAALPVLLFGLGIAITSLTRGGPWHSVPMWRLILSIALGLLPMIAIAIGGLIAFLRKLPDWGLTWVGSAFMGLLILVKTVAEELAEVGQRIISEPVEIGIVIVMFLIGMALLVIVGMRGWQHGGLLSIGFSVTFSLTFLWAVTAAPFYRHDLAIWAGPFSLLLATLTYLYTQSNNSIRLILLFGVGLLNVAGLLTANTIWTDWFQSRGEAHSPLPFVIFMILFLICGPIMGFIARPIQQSLHRA
jgi:hypothetical protein